uniref:Uncharacterized protein n=1 Tax=Schistocephalus solidus TaxID=70667 RepID=A0A0V0J758_SCHSO
MMMSTENLKFRPIKLLFQLSCLPLRNYFLKLAASFFFILDSYHVADASVSGTNSLHVVACGAMTAGFCHPCELLGHLARQYCHREQWSYARSPHGPGQSLSEWAGQKTMTQTVSGSRGCYL